VRVLVLGASGFIGSHIASLLAGAGLEVRAGARRPEAAKRLAPAFEWVAADFGRLQKPSAWAPLLDGVDAVVNCVGVLQDGAGDSTQVAHVTGPRALIEACQAAGVRRLVHVSAVGADEAAGTAYARTKVETEALLERSGLDWVVLRPSLVLGRAVFGGSALMRGLAAFPGCIPAIGGDQAFRPVAMEDVGAAVVRLVAPDAPSRLKLDLAGPDKITLAELLATLRGWLGLKPAPVLSVPRALAQPALWIGDLLGRLGWASPLRSTSLRQMDHDVAGDPAAWARATGIAPTPISAFLSANPATVQDRWHARLYFVRPLSVALLGLYWIASGVIALGPGRIDAIGWLEQGGFGAAASPASDAASVVDIVLGAALFVRPWTAKAALAMALGGLGYLAAGTLVLPWLWADPLGPWLKIAPTVALSLFVAATDARR
jgi:uncharacterized protein YbjT (DUF2867 family)